MTRLVDALRTASRGARRPTPDGGRRAAIAAIFRQCAVTGEEQVLLIRRQVHPSDPWSGHVALPGGRQEESDAGCDEATAIREAREEVGIDLSSPSFEPLGRLVDDRLIRPRGRAMVTSMFGFAARPDAATTVDGAAALELQPAEVADAWWIDTSLIDTRHLGWRVVGIESLTESPSARAPRWLIGLLQSVRCDRVRFAAIDLPPPPGVSISPSGMLSSSAPDGARTATTATATADTTAATATATAATATASAAASAAGSGAAATAAAAGSASSSDVEEARKAYQLWGLTLAFFSDLLRHSQAKQPLIGDGAPPE